MFGRWQALGDDVLLLAVIHLGQECLRLVDQDILLLVLGALSADGHQAYTVRADLGLR